MEADISIKQITQTYSLFYEDERELTDEENESIRLCCDLFRHITTSTEPLSTSQQYRRIRARNLLTEVYLKVGAEVFLLCMLTWSITALARFDSKIVLPKFLQWWKSTPTKEGLKRTADKICNDYGIKKLVKQVKTFSGRSSTRRRTRLLKNQVSKSVDQDQPDRAEHKDGTSVDGSSSDAHPQTYEGQSHGPVVLKVDDIPELQISLLSDQHPQSVFDLQIVHLMAFLQQYHPTSSNPEQLSRILSLFEGYQFICPHIQLVYPWYGSVPSIDIKIDSKIGWSAKVQLSHKLAEELIEYIQNLMRVDVGNGGHRDSQQD